MTMPWWDLHDAQSDTGLYMGYHDPICRFSSWHTYLYPRESGVSDAWLTPADSGGSPLGLVFSHVRYPFIHGGEELDSGEFILRVHPGDWHEGSKFYREWFLQHFPFDKSKSWLRKKSAWFTSIIYQPEDRIVADYKLYDDWCRDAEKYNVDTFELIGWDKGGLERDYPEYIPEPKLGGKEGLRALLQSVDERKSKCLLFVNYNILDTNTDWFKRELHLYAYHDIFGRYFNTLVWGESTLLARRGYARRHCVASVVPPMEKILEDVLLELVRDGAHGFQIDKLCASSGLDFNLLNTVKPDVALGENFIQAIARLYHKCREINPDFCFAGEALQDRLIPYVDVFYRTTQGYDIAPLRHVFPEWTSCSHIYAPLDFRGVNGAVLTGSVICVEPFSYQGSLGHPLYRKLAEYIREVERIRGELKDIIFLGDYFDTQGVKITELSAANPDSSPTVRRVGGEVMLPKGEIAGSAEGSSQLESRVHGHFTTNQRAIVIANKTDNEVIYRWEFLHRKVAKATLHRPFAPQQTVHNGDSLKIEGMGLHILVESE
jgi:hypothetical protein